MGQALHAVQPDEVLCKAVLNAMTGLGLNQAGLGKAIGLDRTSVSRLKARGTLEPTSKPGEIALLVVRIYRSLYALMSGREAAMKHWMHTNNHHLHGVPAELIGSVQGVNRVVEYLDSMRGRV